MNQSDSTCSIAVIVTDRNTDALCQTLRAHLPEVNIQQWPDIVDPESVRLAVLWQHPPGITAKMTNLKTVVSMGAGMDHIDADKSIPTVVQRQRVVTMALQQNMAQYVLQHILNDHRHYEQYKQQQKQQQWQVLEQDEPMPTVGILGLGMLGCFVADRCAELGFKTIAWTAQQKHFKHTCVHGQNGLRHVFQNSRYIVVLLPLNDQTKGIININTLSWCHANTVLINVGRGGHIIDNDLLSVLDDGAIKHAVLDVFRDEPLPNSHPYWRHKKITITPHSSSRSDVEQTASHIVSCYQDLSA